MNSITYNIVTLCKIQGKPLPKYINVPENNMRDLNWRNNIYKLVGKDYQLVDSFFEYKDASDEAKQIMNESPKIKSSLL